ncbi:MAG: hypothetical protein LBF04_06900 [Prevotellaceae bacterium]|jgi:hypothetical protein|nr:hypothetical protein [Prevotellaceae bacterium]
MKKTKADKICFFEDDGGKRILKLCIDIDLLQHILDEETNFRENHFAETLKITGNKFIIKHIDDPVFLRLYSYALDGLTVILRSLISSIKFPAVFSTNNRSYATVDSSEIDVNTLFALCSIIEKYLTMRILCAWYLRCNLQQIYELCKAELDETESSLKNLLSKKTASIPVCELNLGLESGARKWYQ